MKYILKNKKDRDLLIQILQDLDLQKPYNVELKKQRNIRSLSQNAYLHVCIQIYAIHFGYTLAEAKLDLKRSCDFMSYYKNNMIFFRETRKMNSKELTEFIEWIRNYAGMNGCYIPDAETYKLNKQFFEKQIDACKEFL